MEYVVKTEKLTKKFKEYAAVDEVSLHIRRGEIYGFIGRNGAGKTTFMKMLSGLTTPTSGEIELFGQKGSSVKEHRSRIGNLIESPGLYDSMSGFENLHCKVLALGIHKAGYEDELLGMVGLADVGNKRVRKYSLGMKQRLGIAMALVGNPDLLILDEPINGLDPQGIAEIRDTLIRLKEEKEMTIMISSHILEELYKLADTFGIIHQGKILLEMTKEELADKCSSYILLRTDNKELASTVIEDMGMEQYKITDGETFRIYEQLERSAELNMNLVKAGCQVQSLQVVQENLEEFFLELTGGEKNV